MPRIQKMSALGGGDCVETICAIVHHSGMKTS